MNKQIYFDFKTNTVSDINSDGNLNVMDVIVLVNMIIYP